ncbi:MAG: hypothetical protein GY797_04200 [Deltaproteobacteria bacterium]|nr:hypothetical protein [Deltaproteobacteria bacterium]
MSNQKNSPLGIKFIIGFFVLSIIIWIIGQGGAVISYDSVAKLGLQETRESVDPVIVEVNRGIALGDVVIQLPLFILGVVGLWRLRYYGAVASWMALAIHLYWTTVAWAKQFFYLNASIKCQPFSVSLNGVLAFFFLFSAWASWYLFKKRALFD